MRQRCPPSTQGARGPVREPGGAFLEDLRGRHSPAHVVPMYVQRQQHCGTVRGPLVTASPGTGRCEGHSGHCVAASRTRSVGWAGTSPPEPPGPPPSPCPRPGPAQGAPLPGGIPSWAPDGRGHWLSGQPAMPPARCPVVSPRSSQARSHSTTATQHLLSVPGTPRPATFRPGPGSGLHGDPDAPKLRGLRSGSPGPASPGDHSIADSHTQSQAALRPPGHALCSRGRSEAREGSALPQAMHSPEGHQLEANRPAGNCPPRQLAQHGSSARRK